ADSHGDGDSRTSTALIRSTANQAGVSPRYFEYRPLRQREESCLCCAGASGARLRRGKKYRAGKTLCRQRARPLAGTSGRPGAKKVDVIFAMGTVATLAAMKATTEIPIVFSNVGDPVGSGLVSSLARPGGNVTGTSMLTPEAAAKRLQLLKEAFPKISRVAVFVSGEPQVVPQVVEVRNAAKALGMDIQTIELRRREDFANASTVLRKWRADSAYIAASSATLTNRELLADFMLEMQLPGVGPVPNHA